MILDILTKEDFESFKKAVLEAIHDLAKTERLRPGKLLKSYEVCEILGISYGTLRKMKDNGILSATKLGGEFRFDYDEIQKLTKVIKEKENSRP